MAVFVAAVMLGHEERLSRIRRQGFAMYSSLRPLWYSMRCP